MRLTIILLLAGAILSGCNRTQPSTTSSTTAPSGPKVAVDPATSGSINGTVHFTGTAPVPVKIDMSFDPACAMSPRGENMVSPVAAKDGNLANVFVYVKAAPFLADWKTPTEHVVVDQIGCRYEPHVVGAMLGQIVEFHNSDKTDHNIHAVPKNNPEWNESQSPKSAPITKHFNKPEIMVPVKCNQHPWMKMY